jgi:hypothetical protein
MPTPRFGMSEAPVVQDFGSRQILAQSAALARAGSAATEIAADMTARANKVRLDDAQTQFMSAATDLELQARALRGRSALERPDGKPLPDEFAEQLDRSAQKIESALGNEFQRQAFRAFRQQAGVRFRASLTQHMVGEHRTYEIETAKSKMDLAVKRAVDLAGDEGARQESLAAADESVGTLSRLNGWDAATASAVRIEVRSRIHTGLVNTMLASGRAFDARKYYDANSAEMTTQERMTLLPKLQEAGDVQAGEAVAAAVWGGVGPKSSNEAVRIADMEEQVRQRLGANPNAMKAAIDGLRQRAQAHNAQQTELEAQAEAGVWKLREGGASWNQVRQSQAWLALSDTKRRAIRLADEQEQAQRAARAAAEESRRASAANRSLAEAQRELTALQVADRTLMITNGDKFLTLMDPKVLGGMSIAQVEATRTTVGLEGAKMLVQRWHELQKPGEAAAATIDEDAFKQHAKNYFRIDAYSSDKATLEKLGELRFRVERRIDAEQRRLGRKMTPVEKDELMKREASAAVIVDDWWPGKERVPVSKLKDDQMKYVVIPPEDQKLIREALRAKAQQDPSNPAYAETRDNMLRLYLMRAKEGGGTPPTR